MGGSARTMHYTLSAVENMTGQQPGRLIELDGMIPKRTDGGARDRKPVLPQSSLAPKKLEVAIERFEHNPGKPDIVRLFEGILGWIVSRFKFPPPVEEVDLLRHAPT